MLGLGQNQVANLQLEIKSGHVHRADLQAIDNTICIVRGVYAKVRITCETPQGARDLLAILQSS